MLLMGIDVGTTNVKAAVFNINGDLVGYGMREYDIITSRASYAEQDPDLVWMLTKEAIAQAAAECGGDIHAISLSTQGDAIIPIDIQRRPLYNAQLGMDYRAINQVEKCKSYFGSRELFKLTGMIPHPLNSLPKIMWLLDNQPSICELTYKFTTYADFILGKLGSEELVIDHTMASRTMAMDIHTLHWSKDILDFTGLSSDKLSIPVPSGTVVGKLDNTLADELGIKRGATLVAGGHDQTCAALGSGLIKNNIALDSHGTAEVLSTAFDLPRFDDTMFDSFYPCYCHVVPEMYFTFALNHTGGILLKWYKDNLATAEAHTAREKNINVYELIMEKLPDKPSSIVMVPHFNGSGTPTCQLDSKGAILGLTLSTTRHDIAKALLESLSFEMRLNMETMQKASLNINEVRCVGGGARSSKGVQLKADIYNLPVSTLKMREAACLGAAMLAGIGIGEYSNYEEAASIVKISKTYYPRPDYARQYNERYSKYTELYYELIKIQRDLC